MPYASTSSLLQVLDLFADGAVVLAESKDVVQMSESSKQYVGNGLEIRGSRLFVQDRLSNAELQISIDHALSNGNSLDSRFVCLRRGSKRPILTHTMVLEPAPTLEAPRRILLIFCDPERALEPARDVLMQVFGFTSAEARVARELACGLSLDDIAQQHGVAVGTIRSQVKAIFAKAGTRRQVELVALLGRLGTIRDRQDSSAPIQSSGL